jgi:hypothetical protein
MSGEAREIQATSCRLGPRKKQQKAPLYYGNLEAVAHEFIRVLGASHARRV